MEKETKERKDDDLLYLQEIVEELVKLSGLKRSRQTVARWLNSGEIPTVVIMGRRYVRYADLKAYVGKKN
ncbi:MAG: helix-turn-helix domain-containing protein [Candidatus Hydrogenedens sp.]|nr:helix-turn-helix domain-containing protein [Candidatus Hydrogenedens sp.]